MKRYKQLYRESNLIKKAKQHNTVEEFINDQEKIYHGGHIENIKDIKNEYNLRATGQGDPISMLGVNFSDRSTANYFSKRGGGKLLEVNFIPKKIKIFRSYSDILNKITEYAEDFRGENFVQEVKKIRDINKKNEFLIDNQFDSSFVNNFKEDLISKGYDSIKFKNEMDGGITIIPLTIDSIKSNEQLEDTWNKIH